MFKVGLTGGIGSGKTTVCRIFELLGIPIYYADDRAKELMVDNPELVKKIKATFGEDSYIKGELNAPYVAKIVFKDRKQLEKLNSIVHPALGADFLHWADEQKDVPYVIEEAAILIESGGYKQMDKIVLVTAPTAVKMERIRKRDNLSEEEIKNRINSQLSDEDRLPYADYIIKNDGQHFLTQQVVNLHKSLLSLGK